MEETMTDVEIENLAGLYRDMIEDGEVDGADHAYDCIQACGHSEEIANAVCEYLNKWNVKNR